MKKFSKVILVVGMFLPFSLFASVTNGTIDSSNKLTKICKNAACSVFGNVNFKPTLNANTPGATAISITDSGITGFAWGDEIGWINFAPTGAGVTINPATGSLSGTAYSSVGGWINFSPTGAGVTLVDNGSGSSFSGYAYVSGINGGWMKFDCSDPSTCIKTDWRTTSNRASSPSAGSSGSRGGGGIAIFPVNNVLFNPVVEETIPPKEAYKNFPGELPDGFNPVIDNGSQQPPETGTLEDPKTQIDFSKSYEDLKACKPWYNFVCVLQNSLFPLILVIVLGIIGIFLIFWGKKKFK